MKTPVSRMFYGHINRTTEDLTKKMLEKGYSQVPILNSQKHCIGTLIESDLLIKIMKQGPQVRWEPVKNIIAPSLPIFEENTPKDIIEQLLEHQQAILISGERGKIVGIITLSNALESF